MKKLLSLFTALLLCTAMWGATTYKTLYKVEGALYQGLDTSFTGGKKMFVPNDSAVVFTTFDRGIADWYNKSDLLADDKSSYTWKKSFGDYAGIHIINYTDFGKNAIKKGIDYIYGNLGQSSIALSVGTATMNMMSMANGYVVGIDDSTATSNIGKAFTDNKTASCFSSKTHGTYMRYGTDLTHTTHDSVQAYEMILDNPGEMYIDYVVLPIFGYPKNANTEIGKMIPKGKKVTLELYPLSKISKDETGKYSYTKKSTPVSTMTVDAGAYTQDTTKNYGYRGTLKFELPEPVLMTTSFVARLTWDEGCNFGLITDAYNLQNYTTWYIFNDGKYYLWTGGGYNASISYHATFPTLDKEDNKTALNFASIGGSDDVAIKSNIDPADTKEFTIDLGGADEWITMTGITYSSGTYKKPGTDTLKFEAKPNTTGKTRKATITLKHHGKELKYTVSQESMPSAFYEVPANAFFAGMTETGDTAAECKTFYLPYDFGQEYTFTSTEAGTWTSDGGDADESNKNYSYSNRTMKDSCHTPLFAVDEKVGYQYGASGESYDENLYFHIGDSVMHYMTPARLYGEYGKLTNYLRSEYNVGTHSTIGVYFDNKDVMYIDGISIPVKNSASGATEASLFPTGSKITVNIYEAPGIVARSTDNKSKRSSTCKKTIELKSNNYQKYSDDQTQRGALSTTFDPIVITGPFVVELINDGCVFTVYSSTEKENKWGYYIDNNEEVYPATYTPLISVHAMFPVLYPKAGEGESLTIDNIPAKGVSKELGGRPIRNIYANCKYEAEKNGWSRIKPDFITFNFSNSKDYATWYFTIMPNTTGAVREGDVTFKFRGKELTYHVTQKAPTFKAKEGYPDTTQTLYLPFNSDDTVCVYNESTGAYDKVSEIYIESEVTLNTTTISVESKKGLTKIWKHFYNDNGHSVCIRLTREDKQYVMEDTKDTVTISFLGNPENKYEYTILHKGAGKLTTNHNYRTIVFGPKANRKGLFLNDKGELQKDYFINIKAKIPANKILYIANKNRFYDTGFAYGEQGTANEYLQLCPKTKSNTETVLEEDLRILIPNVDTITFHLIQEAKARVWQHNADRDTALEVNDKGDVAHFKGRLTTKMTIVSNTPVTEDDIDIKFSNNEEKWVTPSTEIKQTATRDSVFITFNVAKLEGTEPRSTDITVSILDNEFTVPLTQKTFAIEWSNSGYDEELVVPVAGGRANWKGSDYYYLNVFGTEAYRDELLVVTAPEGVTINRDAPEILTTGRQRTVFYFSKKDTLTADWSGEITVKFDSTNTDENFDYHFSKTFTITQAAAKMWYDANQSKELSFEAEGGDSENIKVWANFPFSYTDIKYVPTNNTEEWFSIYRKKDNAIKDGDNYYYLFYIKTKVNTEEERSGSVYVALKNKTEIKTETLSFTQLAPVPEPTHTREGLVGNYGTLCFPYTPTQEVTGANFYKVLWFNEAEMDLVLEKITGQPEAAVPYIFQYTDTKMVWAYDNTKDPEDISEDGVNGLYGVASKDGYTVSEEDAIAGTYLLSNNQIVKAAVESHAAQYRAYLRLSEVSTEAPAGPATAPRIHMAVPGNGTPTNLNGLNGNVKATKVLRDGQLIIIRDGKTYNAQGIEL